jgi:hypothetical protein
MRKQILYNLYIINNLQVDIDCIRDIKKKLFNISIDVAFPPPIDIVKVSNTFTYNNIMFEYTHILSMPNYYPDIEKWHNFGYNYYINRRLIYVSIIGYSVIEDGQYDTFICYK